MESLLISVKIRIPRIMSILYSKVSGLHLVEKSPLIYAPKRITESILHTQGASTGTLELE